MISVIRLPMLLAGVVLAATTLLSGCAPLVVGGTAATTAIVATDRRTTGEQVEDRAIELKASSEMRRLFEDDARINVTSYAGRVLLTGDVPDEDAKRRAEQTVTKVEKVNEVYNELHVGEKKSITGRTRDTWLTSKVKSALINTKDVPTRTMIVTTEDGIVYLLGRVTDEESRRAAKVASSIKDVKKVVRAFEIVSAESLVTDRDREIEEDSKEQDKKAARQEGEFADDIDVEAVPLDD